MTKPYNKVLKNKRYIGTGTFTADDRTHDYIGEILQSDRISYGEKSKRLERDFSALHGCKYGILSNSGTSSLHVAVQALKIAHGWKDGDEVIVPALTFVATINVVLHNGLKPVLVDVGYPEYGMKPELVEDAVTDRTRAIIPVHLFGQPCQMGEIMDVAREYDLQVIEDSCETMFVKHRDQMVGSMGDIGCFSFYMAHLITAGVGGMAITNNPEYAQLLRSLVNHGLSMEQLNVDENFVPQPAMGREFRFVYPGHSFRITEFEAALALAQLDRWEDMIRIRRRNARHLTASLEDLNFIHGAELLLPKVGHKNEHSWMMYPIVVESQEYQRSELTGYLNRYGVETRGMLPLTNQPIYSEMISPSKYPYAKHINENGFYIGCHQDLEPEDIEYTRQVFDEFYRRSGGS